jgi:mono/diheme cytochrome c family protein
MNVKFGLPLATVALFVVAFLPCTAKGVAKKATGAEAFKMYCASCHAGGGNKVAPNHPLAGSSQLDSIVQLQRLSQRPARTHALLRDLSKRQGYSGSPV